MVHAQQRSGAVQRQRIARATTLPASYQAVPHRTSACRASSASTSLPPPPGPPPQRELNPLPLAAAAFASCAADVQDHFCEIRKILLRCHVIKRTDFLASGYTLMDILVTISILLTLLAKFNNSVTAYTTCAFSTLSFFFFTALLRDLDVSTRLIPMRAGGPARCCKSWPVIPPEGVLDGLRGVASVVASSPARAPPACARQHP